MLLVEYALPAEFAWLTEFFALAEEISAEV
jgi:hypothetical protein